MVKPKTPMRNTAAKGHKSTDRGSQHQYANSAHRLKRRQATLLIKAVPLSTAASNTVDQGSATVNSLAAISLSLLPALASVIQEAASVPSRPLIFTHMSKAAPVALITSLYMCTPTNHFNLASHSTNHPRYLTTVLHHTAHTPVHVHITKLSNLPSHQTPRITSP